jgi:hypothetical protein
MNATFKKLNYKDQDKIFVVNAPKSFEKETDEMQTITELKTSVGVAKEVGFFLGFVTMQKEVDDLTKKVAPLIKGDGLFWLAYPKGSSKKYKCEFNRDNGWNELGKHGFEPVRMVAIDEDWSALRFRRAENIKAMTRGFAISETGKKKVAAGKTKASK